MNVFDHNNVAQLLSLLKEKTRIGRYKQGDIIYDALVAGIDLLTPVCKVPVKYGS